MSDSVRRYWRSWGLVPRLLDEEHLWSVLALLAIVMIAGTEFGARTYDYAEGDIADADVVAPIELRVADPEATESRRAEVRARVVDVYDFDPFAWQIPVASLNGLYAWGRAELAGDGSLAWEVLDPDTQASLTGAAEQTFGLSLPPVFLAAAWAEGFTAETELEAERLLRNQLQHSLIGTLNPLDLGSSSSLRIRDIADQQERLLDDPGAVRDLNAARDWLARAVEMGFTLEPAMEGSLGELLGQLVHPNLNFNSNETQVRRQNAAAAVDQVFYVVQRGRTIVREGDPVTPKIGRELVALGEQWSGGGSQTSSAGLTVVVGLAIFGFWRYVRYRRQKFRFQRVARLYHLILIVLVGSVLMTRVMVFVGRRVLSIRSAVRHGLPGAGTACRRRSRLDLRGVAGGSRGRDQRRCGPCAVQPARVVCRGVRHDPVCGTNGDVPGGTHSRGSQRSGRSRPGPHETACTALVADRVPDIAGALRRRPGRTLGLGPAAAVRIHVRHLE